MKIFVQLLQKNEKTQNDYKATLFSIKMLYYDIVLRKMPIKLTNDCIKIWSKKIYGGRVEKMVILKMMLLGRIKVKKKAMYRKAKQFGYTHPKVVAHSQDLDILINRYHGIY